MAVLKPVACGGVTVRHATLHNPEQVARKDLGMVKPGEQPFVVKDLNTYEGESNTTVAPAEDASLVERVMEAIGSVLP